MSLEQDIRDRIAARRKARGMTQQQLAEALGVTRTYITRLETGSGDARLRLDTIEQAARALDCQATDLLAPAQSASEDDQAGRIIAAFSALDEADRAFLLSVAERLAQARTDDQVRAAIAALNADDRERVMAISRALAERGG